MRSSYNISNDSSFVFMHGREARGVVRLQGVEVEKVHEFEYLGSTVQRNMEFGKDKKRVHAGWNSWRQVSGVICDKRVARKRTGKVYKRVVRPEMLFGLESVVLTKRQRQSWR